MNQIDFKIRNCGTMWTFSPLTERAKSFSRTDLGLESWQWFRDDFVVDHRIAHDLVISLEDEGFVVS